MSKTNLWSREELIATFNLYLKMPFGKMHSRNREIIEFAEIINRSANAVAIRLVNFAHIDPFHANRGIKGMSNGVKQVQPIWDEFFENQEELIFKSEEILAQKQNLTIETKFQNLLFDLKGLKGETKKREVKTRVNQCVFRQMVMVNYNSKCAITGIDIPDLLFASHIIPWSQNEKERLNPENGICLSALYDKAFDKGYIGLDKDYKVLLSATLKKKKDMDYYSKYFAPIENSSILTPIKYLPKKEFLEYHRDIIFDKR